MDPIALRASDQVALVIADGNAVDYRRLVRLVDGFARVLPKGRKGLVALLGDRDLGTVVAYLASLREGQAVAWLGAAQGVAQRRELVRRYDPELVVGPAATIREVVDPSRYTASAVECAGAQVAVARPDDRAEVGAGTSLILLTSGSLTGGRAVRLSSTSVAANAGAIRASLDIDDRARGVTSLPLFYTYGLSVLNCHLSAGGSVLLTDVPATAARFWRTFAAESCEVFSGVPMHYEWLARSSLRWQDASTLRKMTISGGRIRPELAAQFHRLCDDTARRFYKMYGLTEVTARLSVLQHEDFPAHSDSVGRVVPGSSVTIDGPFAAGRSGPPVGRIVYHGPSAMQGYAEDRSDLARPDEMHGSVDTGDVGFLDDGFLHLTGRDGRFVKPDGRRLELDSVEDLFAALAPAAAVGSDGERAHVFIESEPTNAVETARLDLAREFNVGVGAIHLHYVRRLPRRANGKVDYRTLHDRVQGLRAGSLE